MDLSVFNVANLLTLAGLSAAVSAVFEIIKRLWKPAPATLARFGAFIAIGLGIVIGGGAAAWQHVDVLPNVILGIMAGLAAAGVYDTAKSIAP